MGFCHYYCCFALDFLLPDTMSKQERAAFLLGDGRSEQLARGAPLPPHPPDPVVSKGSFGPGDEWEGLIVTAGRGRKPQRAQARTPRRPRRRAPFQSVPSPAGSTRGRLQTGVLVPAWLLWALVPRAAPAGHSVGRGAGCGGGLWPGAHVPAFREVQGPSPSPRHPEALVQFISLNCSLMEPPSRERASPGGSESANERVLVLRLRRGVRGHTDTQLSSTQAGTRGAGEGDQHVLA